MRFSIVGPLLAAPPVAAEPARREGQGVNVPWPHVTAPEPAAESEPDRRADIWVLYRNALPAKIAIGADPWPAAHEPYDCDSARWVARRVFLVDVDQPSVPSQPDLIPRAELEAAVGRAREKERERAAKLVERDLGCTCGGTDIGVGTMHEPSCGLWNPKELAAAIRGRE